MVGSRFGYSVNVDERGAFEADVRNAQGRTVFEISGGDAFDDGFMSDKDDLDGLADHLRTMGVMGDGDSLTSLGEMESAVISTPVPSVMPKDLSPGDIAELYEAAIEWAQDDPTNVVEFDVEHTSFGWTVKQYDEDGDREWDRYYRTECEAKLAVIEWTEKEMDFDREHACSPSP